MMKVQLKNLFKILCIGIIGLSAAAHAKLCIAKSTDFTSTIKLHRPGKTKVHFVQIFSSINATKAEGMKNTLAMRGYPAFINIKDKYPKARYQVQIGPFPSRNLANQAKSSIIQMYPQYPFLNDAILKISFLY